MSVIKKIIKTCLIATILLMMNLQPLSADAYSTGYSEWSTISSGDINEVETIQYGRKTPLTWSKWSNEVPTSLYQKKRIGKTEHYSYSGNNHYWDNADAKTLFTWDFGTTAHVTYFYADVDTYVDQSWTNYIGPPLYLYCDGKLIKKVKAHDCLKNWNPSIDCNCRYLQLKMGDGGGAGRNKTSIVGTWATTTKTEYAYVTSWNDGVDWRFKEPYLDVYGENPQIPTSRKVYSYPLTYKINYDLDGGEASEELITTYTVLDEIKLPQVYKKGYEFLGLYKNDIKYSEIPKGSTGDLNLKALFKRKDPALFIGTYSFKEEDKSLTIKEFLNLIQATGSDELDGDLSDHIKINNIEYTGQELSVSNPTTISLKVAQKINVSFSLTNSGGKRVETNRDFYILKEHSIDEVSNEDIQIYSRYLNSDYNETLASNSIWREKDNQELLEKIYQRMKGE